MSDWQAPEDAAERAWAIIVQYEETSPIDGLTVDHIERLITDLLHLSHLHDGNPGRTAVSAFNAFMEEADWSAPTGERDWAFESDTYTGWDRIHDDNKAEGRPVGEQWTSRGVDYRRGYKVRRSS